jgi:hypothetical protein
MLKARRDRGMRNGYNIFYTADIVEECLYLVQCMHFCNGQGRYKSY